jgi:hypothetical protein
LLCTPALLLPFRLGIDPALSPPVWGEWQADGSRFEIRWPPGFALRSVGEAIVIDGDGNEIGRNGDLISDAGGSGGNPITICSVHGTTYDLT